LISLPNLAIELGVARVVAKDESLRLGLPAFKALGASWAIEKTLRMEQSLGRSASDRLFVTATDGNHGRAVAKFARSLGQSARIFIPDGVHPVAVQAIRDEGAQVVVVGGPYDAAVAEAARFAELEDALLVQDTAWDGYEDVPRWIVEGYATLFAEVDEQLGADVPGVVVVPSGVGSLLQGALAHYRGSDRGSLTRLISVEPLSADCVRASLDAGRMIAVPTGVTVMAGLNCGTVSTLAWPYIQNGLDAAVAISDEDDIQAMSDLHSYGINSGPCGAAALAGIRQALLGPDGRRHRDHLGLTAESTIVLIVTESREANPAG
jgi:diaminopropionate ammonia-lyase